MLYSKHCNFANLYICGDFVLQLCFKMWHYSFIFYLDIKYNYSSTCFFSLCNRHIYNKIIIKVLFNMYFLITFFTYNSRYTYSYDEEFQLEEVGSHTRLCCGIAFSLYLWVAPIYTTGKLSGIEPGLTSNRQIF